MRALIFDNIFYISKAQVDVGETSVGAGQYPYEARPRNAASNLPSDSPAGIGRQHTDALSEPARRPVDVWMH